jgi:hypothetical protein
MSILSEAKNRSSISPVPAILIEAKNRSSAEAREASHSSENKQRAASAEALTARRDQARTQTAAIFTPRMRQVLKHLQANPKAAIAAQDFGHLRYLTKSLDSCPNLEQLRDQTRELALSILDIRCQELQRLIESGELHELSPCDVGVLKERNRILDVINHEYEALKRAAKREQRELARQAQEEADIEAYILADHDQPLSASAKRGEALCARPVMREAAHDYASSSA